MVTTTTFMLARMLLVAVMLKAMRKAGLLPTVLKGHLGTVLPRECLKVIP